MSSNSEHNHSEQSLEIDRARRRLIRVWTWVGAILLAGVGLHIAGMISNAIGIIAWTVVFVFILRGPVNWLDKRGVNRTIGTIASYLLFIAALGLLIFFIFSPSVGINAQFEDLAKSLPSYFEVLERWANDLYAQYADILQSDTVQDWVSSAASSVAGFAQSLATATASGMVAVGASLANTIMCIGFALVIAFWMLVSLPQLGREVNRLLSDDMKDDAQMLHITITRVMGGYLTATIIQCGVIGVLCGVLFWILGVPSPAALAVITGLLNIIPIVGPWLGGALAFIASFGTSPIVGVISLVGTIVIQQIVYTFVSPKLMSESVDIHPALTFIALMAGSGIGTALGGLVGALVGALLSIPFVAIIKSIFVYYFEKRTGRRIVAEDGVFFKGAANEEGELDPIADATAPGPAPAPAPSLIPMISDFSGKLPIVGGDDGTNSDAADDDASGDK